MEVAYPVFSSAKQKRTTPPPLSADTSEGTQTTTGGSGLSRRLGCGAQVLCLQNVQLDRKREEKENIQQKGNL